jgi:hypothetical protein
MRISNFISMKSLAYKIGHVIVISLIFNFHSCDDVETLSEAGFARKSGLINETDISGIQVEIPISPPAAGSGKIVVYLDTDAQYGTDYLCDKPLSFNTIELPVGIGDSRTGFKITPVYNNLYKNSFCDDKLLKFQLYSFSGVIKPGINLDYNLTIIDSDASDVAFAESSGSVSENNPSGILLHINITPAAKEDTYVYVYASDNGNANKYTTTATLVQDIDVSYIVINVPKNSPGADLKILPVNNTSTNDNYEVVFGLMDSYTCFKINSMSKYRLTIEEDD